MGNQYEAPRQHAHAWALCGILGAAVVLALCSLRTSGPSSGTNQSDIDYLGAVRPGLQHAGLHAGFVPAGRHGMLGAQYRPPQVIRGNMRQPGNQVARRASIAAWNSPRHEVRGAQAAAAVVEVHSEDELGVLTTESDGLVVLNVGTSWCVPCKIFMPKYQNMAEEFNEVKFLKVNGDENESTQELMQRLGVRSVPVFVFFKNGQEIGDRVAGAKEAAIRSRVTELAR
eukprot:gnl/TRDRNA2_/TRDRNA2_175817_c0_seq2.p1 gnl/TRDRNA2_/TRDRNA2_175817_c0~~gnl/TRDRNA2_/TRDRNA2_175817_c0_seq2.p1  ORF type:complete len:228 (+),score=31.76 gnl/TRDRNA2_/TRDRNA2_175817_c0_seq2:61-744(+)